MKHLVATATSKINLVTEAASNTLFGFATDDNNKNNHLKSLTMKRFFLSIMILFGSISCIAQETVPVELGDSKLLSDRKHEVKIGTMKLILGSILDVEYERILSNYTSVGGNLVYAFDDRNVGSNRSLTGYFRFYFNEKKDYGSEGFFGQVFGGYYGGDRWNFFDEHKSYGTGALGFSVGKKRVSEKGFVLQTMVGVGRTMDQGGYAPDIVGQGDISIGYRF